MQVLLPSDLLLITFRVLGPLQTHFEMFQVQSQGGVGNYRREVQKRKEWVEETRLCIRKKDEWVDFY